MKVVDTGEYVSMLRELTEEGHEVTMTVAGSSMSPFLIHNRDVIAFKKLDHDPVKGDIVFYQRRSGQYVMHRICAVKPDGYYIVGDAQTAIEGPVARDQIFAIITKIRRKDRWMGPGDFWWEFFRKTWVNLIPVRPLLVKTYSVFSRLTGRGTADKKGQNGT